VYFTAYLWLLNTNPNHWSWLSEGTWTTSQHDRQPSVTRYHLSCWVFTPLFSLTDRQYRVWCLDGWISFCYEALLSSFQLVVCCFWLILTLAIIFFIDTGAEVSIILPLPLERKNRRDFSGLKVVNRSFIANNLENNSTEKPISAQTYLLAHLFLSGMMKSNVHFKLLMMGLIMFWRDISQTSHPGYFWTVSFDRFKPAYTDYNHTSNTALWLPRTLA